jgi:hypothetical protein
MMKCPKYLSFAFFPSYFSSHFFFFYFSYLFITSTAPLPLPYPFAPTVPRTASPTHSRRARAPRPTMEADRGGAPWPVMEAVAWSSPSRSLAVAHGGGPRGASRPAMEAAARSTPAGHGGGRAELPGWYLVVAHLGGVDRSRLSQAPSTSRRRRPAASLHHPVILRPAPRRRLATSPRQRRPPTPPRGSLEGIGRKRPGEAG